MEQEFHRWLQQRFSAAGPQTDSEVLLGPGDDAALLRSWDGPIVMSTDTIAEGTHFLLEDGDHRTLQRIGRKLAAVNLSDLAAMGAAPVAMTLNFQVPRNFRLSEVQSLFLGAEQLAREFSMAIVGGDTNSWEGPLVVSATVLGRQAAGQSGWRMSGARVDDVVLLSGACGGSLLGRHLEFTPRVELAMWLVERGPVHAATDVSDSLTLDLQGIARASRVSICLDVDQVPISTDVPADLAPEQRIQAALYDGEDFELILTMAEADAMRILSDPELPCPLQRIGQIQAGPPGVVDSAGNAIPVRGYIH